MSLFKSLNSALPRNIVVIGRNAAGSFRRKLTNGPDLEEIGNKEEKCDNKKEEEDRDHKKEEEDRDAKKEDGDDDQKSKKWEDQDQEKSDHKKGEEGDKKEDGDDDRKSKKGEDQDQEKSDHKKGEEGRDGKNNNKKDRNYWKSKFKQASSKVGIDFHFMGYLGALAIIEQYVDRARGKSPAQLIKGVGEKVTTVGSTVDVIQTTVQGFEKKLEGRSVDVKIVEGKLETLNKRVDENEEKVQTLLEKQRVYEEEEEKKRGDDAAKKWFGWFGF